MLKDICQHRASQAASGKKSLKTDIAATTKKIDADSPALINAYETQIRKLEEQLINLEEKSHETLPARAEFETLVRTAMEFLANPWKLWASDSFEHKRLTLKLVFAGPIPYCR